MDKKYFLVLTEFFNSQLIYIYFDICGIIFFGGRFYPQRPQNGGELGLPTLGGGELESAVKVI